MSDWCDYLGQILTDCGPWSAFFAGLLDSGFIPLAQGVDLLLVTQAVLTPKAAYASALLAVAGSTLGSLLLYAVARRGGGPMLKHPAIAGSIDRVRRHLERYGALSLAFPTMLPIPLPMRPLVVAAGVLRMNLGRFVGVIAIARGIRYLGLALLAANYGGEVLTLVQQHALTAFLFGAAPAGILIFVAYSRVAVRRGKLSRKVSTSENREIPRRPGFSLSNKTPHTGAGHLSCEPRGTSWYSKAHSFMYRTRDGSIL